VVAVRGRRRLLAALAALVALVALGLSSSGASASSASTILFSEQEAGIQFASSGDDSIGQSIQVNLAADKTPLPRKLAIEIPTGYTLDLDAASGETIAFGSIGVFGVDSSSFAVGSGELVAKDPTSFLADRVAQACAPGVHAAAWELSTTLAGQRVSMKVFVDAGGPPGIAYVLRVCSTGLATGDTDSSAFISLMGLGGLELPTSPGDYRWRVLVTPEIREPYELQALVPLPESVTLKARYDEKRKTALLTGTVVEGGQPVARAHVFVTGSRNGSDLGPWGSRTDGRGRFALRTKVKRTTTFIASVAATPGVCSGDSAATCLGSMTIPPDAGYTTVWVSVRGGAHRTIRAADQTRAEREGLQAADLTPGFGSSLSDDDACLNPKHESGLTITGEATSPSFYRIVSRDPPSLVQASAVTRVYATAGQAGRAFTHQARASTLRCELKDLESKLPEIKPLSISGLPSRVRAFRAAIEFEDGLSANYDLIFLARGRSMTILGFFAVNGPPDLEQTLAMKLAARLR
jgi:hypothetical protein